MTKVLYDDDELFRETLLSTIFCHDKRARFIFGTHGDDHSCAKLTFGKAKSRDITCNGSPNLNRVAISRGIGTLKIQTRQFHPPLATYRYVKCSLSATTFDTLPR